MTLLPSAEAVLPTSVYSCALSQKVGDHGQRFAFYRLEHHIASCFWHLSDMDEQWKHNM